MRYTTRINNRKCLEWGINAAQAALFDLLNECAGWAKPVVVDGEVFHWVSRHLVVEELPLFFSKPDTAYRAMKALEEKGLIEYQRNGNWELVRITAKGATWNSHDAAKENSDSDSPGKNPSVRKNFREVGKKSEVSETDSYRSEKYPSSPEKNPNGSEKFPRDKYINKQITNHGINQDCSARAAHATPPADAPNGESAPPCPAKAEPENGSDGGKRFHPLKALLALGVDRQVAEDWLAFRKVRRAPLTRTALDGVIREAGKAGITVGEAVRIAAEKPWVGFKADWDWRSGGTPQGRVIDHAAGSVVASTGNSAVDLAQQQAARAADWLASLPTDAEGNLI